MADSEANVASAPSARPREVGGYEIVSKLGQGGMGAVFKARQKSLDRIVALKILPPQIAKDAVFIERFQREARASAKLNHPNIVQGIDVGKDPATGLWYFAMEYVDGPSLHQVLKEQKLFPEKRALEIVRDIARALECAGHNGIVHRDIKPDNILLTQRGEAKLADLGLAKQMSDDASVTQSGQSVGTPNYMAPEQARGAVNEIDIRTDIYALGGTLFHLVTGKTPYSGETSVVIMTKHLTEPPPKARLVNPEVSEATSRLIVRMMGKKREQRVQNPATLIQQIEEILNQEAPAAKAETGTRRARQDTTGPRAPVGGTKPAQMAMAAGALILLGILGYVVMTPKPAEPSPVTKEPDQPVTRPAPVALNKPPGEKQPVAIAKPPTTPAPVAIRQPSTPTPPVPAEAPELVAQRLLDEIKAEEQVGKLSAAELKTRYVAFARAHGGTPAGKEAIEKVKALLAATAPEVTEKPVPAETVAKTSAASQAAAEAAEKEAKLNKAQELFSGVLKELAPLLAANKFTDAHSLLDQKIGSSALADARELLKQEKADVQAIQDVRKQAVEALRKMAGKTVSLKKGNNAFSGKIIAETKPESVTLRVANGPELTLSSEQLHIQDVDQYADNASPEDFRRRGLLFLAAGDKENLGKAKMNFIRAKDGGIEAAGQYLERITALEMGEVEVAAEKTWIKAEAIFNDKKFKEAEDAYTSYQQKYAKTKSLAKNSEIMAQRLKAIERTYKPEITFRADESMKMFPNGQKYGEFPVQDGQDPLAPFENKAAYFMQTTGTDVVYEVKSYKPLKQIRWKGAAMQKMTIEILDAKGTVLATGGPYAGGNRWAEFTLTFDPRKEFVLRFRNHVSTWYLISEIELK